MKQTNIDTDQLLSGYKVPGTTDKAKIYQQLSRRIDDKTTHRHQDKTAPKTSYWLGTAVAAALLLIFCLINTLRPTLEIANKEHTMQLAQLPDSSQVKLKVNTTINYRESLLDGTRKVEMTGEAYFDVSKGKPFLVQFPGGQLKVLGTQFNIRSYQADYGRVDCYEGAVQLNIDGKQLLLHPGQTIRYSPAGVEGPLEFDMQKALKIPADSYQWVNRPLSEILSLICARTNYELIAPEHILERRFTGTLKLTNEKMALSILAKAMNFNYEINETKLIVREKLR